MEIECTKCSLQWDYGGQKKPNENFPVYVTCPRCRNAVKMKSEGDE